MLDKEILGWDHNQNVYETNFLLDIVNTNRLNFRFECPVTFDRESYCYYAPTQFKNLREVNLFFLSKYNYRNLH